jgi:hypothetical protein
MHARRVELRKALIERSRESAQWNLKHVLQACMVEKRACMHMARQ